MSYTAENHKVYSERTKNWCKAAQDLLDEGKRMDQIFLNEAASGSDPEYVDNGNGTAAEHTDVVTMIRAYVDFIEGNAVATLDRQPVLSPFTQQV